MSVYSQHESALQQVYAQAPQTLWEPKQYSRQLETHDVILREHKLPGLSEKVYKTQSQHTQSVGLIVFTVEQLWWITGFTN